MTRSCEVLEIKVNTVAADGTRIPISLVWRGDAELPRDRPCMLYGYGSYGLTIEPRFRSTWLSLCERDVVVGIAHIRGGGYLGRRWYEAAKFLTKERTFEDFIAAGRHLCASGITSPDKLGIMGGSAGGMLVGAVINRAPDLCRAAVAAVPFVDVVSTMLDASLPLTTGGRRLLHARRPIPRAIFTATALSSGRATQHRPSPACQPAAPLFLE